MYRFSLLALIPAFSLTACERPAERPIQPDAEPPVEYMSFGEPIPEEGPALTPADLAEDPVAYHGQTVRVEGSILEVCQEAGCWIALDNPVGEPVRVDVPRVDGQYEWTVPTELGRLPAIVEGTAYADTLGAEELRRFAEEAGRAPEQVGEQPRLVAHITARGMLVEEPAAPAPPVPDDGGAATAGQPDDPRTDDPDPASPQAY